eukprot:CAMPEP_0119320068 /NCGR_PEP_ID=MMETSP1333-20130426/51335_1 /TAXON_ID=418940 /ORGANISM="Scyphosphaera apsteinii, Strain RCC1455" /LENGTH=185 /DNA_ID=CAMNT_0007326675 /DNA_START=366 /DNA_END=919 /DNA_ORIENTATION=-
MRQTRKNIRDTMTHRTNRPQGSSTSAPPASSQRACEVRSNCRGRHWVSVVLASPADFNSPSLGLPVFIPVFPSAMPSANESVTSLSPDADLPKSLASGVSLSGPMTKSAITPITPISAQPSPKRPIRGGATIAWDGRATSGSAGGDDTAVVMSLRGGIGRPESTNASLVASPSRTFSRNVALITG